MHYLQQFCCFGIIVLSIPVMLFHHQCIIYTSTVVSASMHYLHQDCRFGTNALSTPVMSFRHQCIIYISNVVSASMHYLHQYCRFGTNALSTPVLSFRHQCIIYISTVVSASMHYLHQYCRFGTSADAEPFVFSWTLNSKYVIDVDIMINIIVCYIICSVYHDFAAKVKHIFKLYETIMETVSWLSWKYSYIALHFTFLFYCDIPHIHVKRVLVVQGHLVTPWPWLLIRGFKILFIEIFLSMQNLEIWLRYTHSFPIYWH